MKDKYCMIEVAFDQRKEVEEAINTLLEKRLVSGCQVVESSSKWRWKGKLESSREYLLFMKTRESLVDAIYSIIKKIHSYECFEFAIFSMTSNYKDYLNWIKEETEDDIYN